MTASCIDRMVAIERNDLPRMGGRARSPTMSKQHPNTKPGQDRDGYK